MLDRQRLQLAPQPSSKDQQVLEALAMLQALRLWGGYWLRDRVTLTVQSVNVATLSMVAKMQPHSAQMGLIARELAMDVSKASYSPDIVEHIPGITNQAADALSRLHEPGKHVRIPHYLHRHQHTPCPPRGPQWWVTLCDSAIDASENDQL